MARVVIAVFDSQYIAKKAVQELCSYGFERDFIHIMRKLNPQKDHTKISDVQIKRIKSEVFVDEVKAGSQVGAGIGAAIGLSAGLLINLGALPFSWVAITDLLSIALVLFGAMLTGAFLGFIVGRLLGGSIGFGFPESEAEQYARNVCPSGIQVSVFADRTTVETVLEILNKFNPLEIQEETTSSLKPGWIGRGA